MNQRILKIIKYTKGPKVLDVGCVGGKLDENSPYWLHKYLRDKFDYVVGIDINREAITVLRNKGYRVYLGDAQSFSLNEKFNTIVAGELIEHLSNPGQFLERAKCHLEKDGRIVLTTPYAFGLVNVLYAIVKFPKTCSNPEHTVWFCPSTLTELVQRYGFKVRHWELVEDYYSGVPSLKYRLLVWFLKIMRPLLPKRLTANCLLYVLEPKGGKSDN